MTRFSDPAQFELKGRPRAFRITRHSRDCKYAGKRTYRRCNCPKWIGGQVNKDYFRRSAGTHQWNEAEEYRLKLEDALAKNLPPFGPEPESVLTPAGVSAPVAPPLREEIFDQICEDA